MQVAVMATLDGYILYVLSFWLGDKHEKWFDWNYVCSGASWRLTGCPGDDILTKVLISPKIEAVITNLARAVVTICTSRGNAAGPKNPVILQKDQRASQTPSGVFYQQMPCNLPSSKVMCPRLAHKTGLAVVAESWGCFQISVHSEQTVCRDAVLLVYVTVCWFSVYCVKHHVDKYFCSQP